MDIAFAEMQKKMLRLTLFLAKKLSKCATRKYVHDDLKHAGNLPIHELYKLLMEAASHIESKRGQKEVISEISTFALWVAYKDTAYTPILFWLINEILKNPKHWKKIIEPYVIPPKDWYVNRWIKSVDITKELQEEGKIPPHTKSEEETIFIPSFQRKRINKIKPKR